MRLLGKRPDLKLKSVTIIHSSTTETVRLPPEGTEGVTVHPPAVRAKLPLSRKVREKRRQHRKHKDNGHGADKCGKDASKKKKKKQQQPQAKRVSASASEDSGRKRSADAAMIQEGGKRKKALRGNEKQNGGNSESNEKRKRKKQHKSKEVIDYSGIQAEKESEPNADPKSKVRSWLLASSQCRPETGRGSGLPKSKSTPVGLTGGGARLPPATRQPASRRNPIESKEAKITGNPVGGARKERAKLQVVYKPPFRFTVKLRKSDKVAQVSSANANGRPKLPRTGVLLRTGKKKDRVRIGRARQIAPTGIGNSAADLPEPANSDLHTVPSDLEVLLSESEFLFSDT